MNGKIIFALVLVAFAAAAESKIAVKPKVGIVKKSEPNSADVEAKLDPTVHSLPKGQHKLVFKGASGQEQCVVCQPFQGCGCRDVVAIRCELKRLKQKLLRLKRIAQPHEYSHHGRKVENKPKKADHKKVKVSAKKPATEKKPAVKVTVEKKPVEKKPEVKVAVKKPATEKKPKVKVTVVKKPAVKKPATEKKPQVKLAIKKPAGFKPAVIKPAVIKPAVLPAVHSEPLVKLAVQPTVHTEEKPAVKPAVLPAVHSEPLVKLAVQPAVHTEEKPAVKPLIKAQVLPLKAEVAVQPAEKKNTGIVAPVAAKVVVA